MSSEEPETGLSKDKKPEMLFDRLSVVVNRTFFAAISLNIIYFNILVALYLFNARWGLWSWAIDWLPLLSKPPGALRLPIFIVGIIQLTWWIILILCYLCGKKEEFANKHRDDELLSIFDWDVRWLSLLYTRFKISMFPVGSTLAWGFISFGLFSALYLLAECVDWIWHLFFI